MSEETRTLRFKSMQNARLQTATPTDTDSGLSIAKTLINTPTLPIKRHGAEATEQPGPETAPPPERRNTMRKTYRISIFDKHMGKRMLLWDRYTSRKKAQELVDALNDADPTNTIQAKVFTESPEYRKANS